MLYNMVKFCWNLISCTLINTKYAKINPSRNKMIPQNYIAQSKHKTHLYFPWELSINQNLHEVLNEKHLKQVCQQNSNELNKSKNKTEYNHKHVRKLKTTRSIFIVINGVFFFTSCSSNIVAYMFKIVCKHSS